MWCRVTLAAVGVLLTLDGVQSEETAPQLRIDPNCECGVSGEAADYRIVGGVVSAPHMYPWIVELLNRGRFTCAGSIINDRYILTAGHCVKELNAEDITIVLGAYNKDQPGQGIQVAVEQVIVNEHIHFNGVRNDNDIALLKLKYPIQFSRNFRPICLPRQGTDYSGQRAVVAGWGRVSETGPLSRVLKQTVVTIYSWHQCLNSPLGDQITEAMLCAHDAQSDTCKGDSGGPLMIRRHSRKYEEIGIVSWGIGCERRHLPGIYTRTQYFLNWIQDNTRDAMYCMDR